MKSFSNVIKAMCEIHSKKHVPAVCPVDFNDYFCVIQPIANLIEKSPDIPAKYHSLIIINICFEIAKALYGESLALEYTFRYFAINNCVANGMVAKISRDLFGDPDYLVVQEKSRMYIRGIVICSAGFALLTYDENGFDYNVLCTAILSAPAGCPIKPCPKKDTKCKLKKITAID